MGIMYEPRYIITHNILRYIGSIEAAREMVNNAALVPAWEAQFQAAALHRNVHHGTHLEGNGLSKEQAERIIILPDTQAEEAAEKAGIVGRNRDVQEVINYREVMRWIDELGSMGRDRISLSEDVFKQIHQITTYRILPEDERGHYRNVQVVVKNSQTGEITFKPPLSVEVPYHLEAFFSWINSKAGRVHHPIIRAGITHYELVRIHPFVDGNGRVARAMALLLLYADNYDAKRFFSLEEYYDKNAGDYYRALQSVGEGDAYDLTYWLEYFTQGLAIELDKVKQQVLKLSRDLQLKQKIGHQIALSERQIRMLEIIHKHGGRVVSSELEKIFPLISVDTILRDLKDMVSKKLIIKRGRTKGASYELLP
jgi:Fic family protein